MVMPLVAWVAEASTWLVRGPGASVEAGAAAPEFVCVGVVASGRLDGGRVAISGSAWTLEWRLWTFGVVLLVWL
jgi:hypothetical protein